MKKQIQQKSIQVLLLSFILVLLTSCKEEEFYEKDELTTYKEEYEKNNPIFDPEISVDETDNDSADDSAGDSDGGTNDDGTGDSGSGDNGSGDNGSGDDGSGNDDSGDNGSGDDGSGDDGTGDDGSGDDGSGDNDSGIIYLPASDDFTQNSNGQKIDILWVVDNSGSMQEEQADLAYNFNIFINEFIKKNIDFKMSITTTDTSSYYRAGRPVTNSFELLTSNKLAENENKFLDDFANLIQVGTNGSGYEKGIKASEIFTKKHAEQNFRKDAYYIIVYLSDEEDQSGKTPEARLAEIQRWKDNKGLVKAYSIVNMSNQGSSSSWNATGYERYEKMSTLTGGQVSDINNDFYSTLLNMGEEIAALSDRFPLAQTPVIEKGINVFVNNVKVTSGWTYDANTNSIVFDQNSLPPVGASIKAQYQVIQ